MHLFLVLPKAQAFVVMATVACNSSRQDRIARAKIDDFGAVEKQNLLFFECQGLFVFRSFFVVVFGLDLVFFPAL
jgi:hypothetical protein